MKVEKLQDIFYYKLEDADTINQALLKGFENNLASEQVRKTHFFGGRFENIYIDQALIPEITTILDEVTELAAEILAMPKNKLKAGLWFNAMGPGHATTAHRHDDFDELLSAVYYVTVPANSGELILSEKNFSTHVTPEAGMFVFFPPDMMHEVTENRSNDMRLSLGINIGPVKSD